MKGRIWFAGNPWPKGHAIEEAAWTGRLDPSGALFFDLHLESADYDVEDRSTVQDRPAGEGAWKSRVVWTNYHRCILSSVKWQHRGLEVGSPSRRLDWRRLDGATLRADRASDTLPDDDDEAAFGIYLLGHDGVADHRLRFDRSGATWSIAWRAKVALAYTGNLALDYTLRAELRGLRFGGFAIPPTMTPKAARTLFAAAVTDPARWTIAKRRFVRA